MRCAYRLRRDQHGERTVDLHIDSFDHHAVSDDFVLCDWPTLLRAWRLKDRIALRRLAKEQKKCGSPSPRRSGSSARPR